MSDLKKILKAVGWLMSFCVLQAAVSCGSATPQSNLPSQGNSEKRKADYSSKASFPTPGVVSCKNVSFSLDDTLQTFVTAEEVEAFPLGNATDKPGSAHPNHVVFRFEGEYGDKFRDSKFSPEILVYPISSFRDQLAVSRRELNSFDQKLTALRKIISATAPIKESAEIPFVRFIDAGPNIQARIELENFEDGKGVWTLTQYDIEPSLVNNQGLTFIYQGISADGEYYILATFPVSLPHLPKDYTVRRTGENQTVEDLFSDPQKLKDYKKRIVSKLENAAFDEFEPSLDNFRNIVRSLSLDSD